MRINTKTETPHPDKREKNKQPAQFLKSLQDKYTTTHLKRLQNRSSTATSVPTKNKLCRLFNTTQETQRKQI